MTESLDKIKYIESIANFDRAVIDRLIEYLQDDSLLVRHHAYCKLNLDNLDPQVLSERDWALLPKGILLNPGDIVWTVYQSGLDYDDNHFGICDFSSDSDENIYGEEMDTSYYYFSGNGAAHKFISTHVDWNSAESAANEVIKEIIRRDEYPYSGFYYLDLQVEEISQQDIYNLANQYNIPDLPQPENSQPIRRNCWNDEKRDESYWMREDRLRSYAIDILQRLTVDKHYNLIDKIYGNLFGRLAYVRKETVRETTYFKP